MVANNTVLFVLVVMENSVLQLYFKQQIFGKKNVHTRDLNSYPLVNYILKRTGMTRNSLSAETRVGCPGCPL
jgi:hypothetical protein